MRMAPAQQARRPAFRIIPLGKEANNEGIWLAMHEPWRRERAKNGEVWDMERPGSNRAFVITNREPVPTDSIAARNTRDHRNKHMAQAGNSTGVHRRNHPQVRNNRAKLRRLLREPKHRLRSQTRFRPPSLHANELLQGLRLPRKSRRPPRQQ